MHGSLAATGKGHMTDYIIKKTLVKPTEIIWKFNQELPLHPNGMILEAYLSGKKIDDWEIYSVGGGEIIDENSKSENRDIYPQNTMADIIKELEKNGGTLWQFN